MWVFRISSLYLDIDGQVSKDSQNSGGESDNKLSGPECLQGRVPKI